MRKTKLADIQNGNDVSHLQISGQWLKTEKVKYRHHQHNDAIIPALLITDTVSNRTFCNGIGGGNYCLSSGVGFFFIVVLVTKL